MSVAAVRGIPWLRDDVWAESPGGVVLAYLTGSGDLEPGRGQMDFFDVWA